MLWGKSQNYLACHQKQSIFVVCSALIWCIFKSLFLKTMHESESKELEWRLPWHQFVIWSRRMRCHLLFAMPTALTWMPLLPKWNISIITGPKPFGMICRVSVKALKSEVTLELLSRLDLIHTVITPPLGSRFWALHDRGCSSLWGYIWCKQRPRVKGVSFQERNNPFSSMLALLLLDMTLNQQRIFNCRALTFIFFSWLEW